MVGGRCPWVLARAGAAACSRKPALSAQRLQRRVLYGLQGEAEGKLWRAAMLGRNAVVCCTPPEAPAAGLSACTISARWGCRVFARLWRRFYNVLGA